MTSRNDASLVLGITGLILGLFLLDLSLPLGVADGVLYSGVVILAFASSSRRFPIFVAGLCSGLDALGAWFSPTIAGVPTWMVLTNRLFSVLVIWTPVLFFLQRRRAEESLRRAYDELEARVQERTSELASVNKALVAEITERMETERSLRASEERFRLLVEGTQDYAIFLLDREGLVASWNAGAARVIGYKADEIIGRSFARLYLPDDERSGKPRRQLEQAAAQGRVEDEGWRVRRDGSRFWANVVLTALRDESGRLRGFLKITRDVTERKQAEEALRLQSVVAANMAEGICLVRKSDTTIVYANPTFEHIFGYGSDELTGKPVGIINAPGEAADDIVRQLDTVGVWKGEILNRKKDGTPFWSWASISTLEHPEHGTVWVAVHSDITDRKRAQQALEASQQALRQSREELRALAARLLTAQEEERRRLSRDLHDDVNQRLAMLTVEVETLERSLPSSPERIGRGLRTIQERLAELSDDVRHLAYQYHPSILDDLGLPIALQRLIDDFSGRTGIKGTFVLRNVADPLPQTVSTCLYRVAQESLGNASRHANASCVDVELAGVEQGVALTVRDNGCGFDLKLVKRRQTGLGLVSMKERVRLVNGTFDIASGPGQGTSVRVWIPVPGRSS